MRNLNETILTVMPLCHFCLW